MFTPTFRNEQTDLLMRALISLQSEEEAYRFLEDVMTIQELQSVAQRLHVAQLLQRNVTYQQIAHETGASTATVSRVNRSLRYGAQGYELVLRRIAPGKNPTEASEA